MNPALLIEFRARFTFPNGSPSASIRNDLALEAEDAAQRGQVEQQGVPAHRRRDRARRRTPGRRRRARPSARHPASTAAPRPARAQCANASPSSLYGPTPGWPPAAPPGAPGSASAPRPRTGRAQSRSTTSHHTTWWGRKDSPPATGRQNEPTWCDRNTTPNSIDIQRVPKKVATRLEVSGTVDSQNSPSRTLEHDDGGRA